MTKLAQDLRYALRTLGKSPGFAAAAVATLALGIGANTAIFSVVHGVLLKSLPFPNPDRIVEVAEADASGRGMPVCDPNFRDFREQNRSLAALAEWNSNPTSVSGGSEPVRVVGAVVSGDFFASLGVRPAIGRAFAAEELQPGGPPAVIVSQSFWDRFLSRDKDLSRHALRFSGDLYRVIGVMPAGFRFPDDAQLWTARERLGPEESRSAHNWQVVGRLRDGVGVEAARADLNAIGARIKREHGQDVDLVGAAVVPLKNALVGRVRPALLMLLGAVAFLMLVAGANVTNLALARTTARRRELAVRSALGASRADILRVLFAEALIVALAGAAAGVLLCAWSLGTMKAFAGASLPRADEIAIDLPVLGFAVALSIVAALVVALVAARRPAEARVPDLAAGRSAGSSSGAIRAQGLLLGVQAAMTALLLVGLALFARSFLRLLAVEPGFRAEGVLAMDLFPAYAETDADKVQRAAFVDRLLDRLAAVPGVRQVGAVGSLPLGSEMANGTFLLVDGDKVPTLAEFSTLARDSRLTGDAYYCPATDGYFRALGIPLLRGRLFDARDGADAGHVALISSTLARTRFAGRDPIGQRIEFGNMDGDLRLLTIVGVVGDVRQRNLERPPESIIYVNFRQRPQHGFALTAVLRIDGDPAAVIAASRAAVRDLDPTLPPQFRALDRVVAESLTARRFSLTLLAIFGALALLLATAGIASVTAFSVARRRPELGIRLALGARPADLLRLLVSRHLRIIGAGAAAGLATAALLAQVLRAQLYGVPSLDPWSYAAGAALLLAVGFAACAVPAMQVGAINPSEAFRTE